ncbi:MAG: hypothetical protein GX803_03545 [Lentisphaerae bacterium]|jgi:hypothetical protein|nr:hypothetical protein [Lentisphaerota bacterium]
MNDTDKLKQRFLNMSKEKQRRIYDRFAELFARLEADWKAKPENAGKAVPYKKLWDDFSSQRKEAEQGVDGYPPQGVETPER